VKRYTGILFEEEKEALAKVETKAADARTILRRNSLALFMLKKGTNGDVNLGCPHCINAGGYSQCDKCEWAKTKTEVEKEEIRKTKDSFSFSFYCCYQTFGGYIHKDCSPRLALSKSVLCMYDCLNRDFNYDACYYFLLGHVEWAQDVLIANGGEFSKEPDFE
jgi:hypothetical protein